jgi:hypothetical protein
VFTGTLCSEATFRTKAMFPRPIERGSLIDRAWTSLAGSPPVESPVGSSRIFTGAVQGSEGGVTTGAVGVTDGLRGPSPAAFTAASWYVYVVPAVIDESVYPRWSPPTDASRAPLR